MKYTVHYSPSAENELADIYLNAIDRQAVTKAAHQIDQMLAVDAHDKGRDCDGDRILRIGPVLVFFAVYRETAEVEVLQFSPVD